MKKIEAPFTEKQVENLNLNQQIGHKHGYTCGGPRLIGCERIHGKEGLLIATEEGLVCPCGQYIQAWAWDMS